MSLGGNDQDKNIKDPPSLHERIFQGAQKADSLFSDARIHRVPGDLRELKKSAYTPRLIAIGPLHRELEQLQKPMPDVKKFYTLHLLHRVAKGIEEDKNKLDGKRKELLEGCEKKMKEEMCVAKAKRHYAEEIKVKNNDEMAEMMLVDGCFILELLCSYHDENSKASSSSGGTHDLLLLENKSDPIFDSISTAEIVKHDLLLLENQIPFFVLEELFTLTVHKIPEAKIPGGKKLSLIDYVVLYFSDIMSPEGENSGSKTKNGGCCCNSPGDCVLWVRGCTTKEPYHILHLLHQHYLPVKNKKPSGEKTTSEVCASDLDYAGVKFVPVEDKNLFAVNFKERNGLSWWFRRARFEIPALHIHDSTEPFFRNLIALEQCCPNVSLHFTSYAKLMDMLINSEEDVKALQNAKVIHNYLGSDKDVCDLFNNLCKEVVRGQFYFNDECQKAFEYSKRWWPQFMAYLRRTFFASPWAFIGFCLALIAFGIQITDFVHSFLK